VGEDRFATRLLAWFERHGRRDLPWQRDRSPYRVWVSEVMLQQTRVATVIPYFERFTGRFPGVRALADAPLDPVLALWSGLGYYARARNLHRAAGIVRDRHAGVVPDQIEALAALPGVGRSTAGAILALALGQRYAILDGNVRRVLARYHSVDGWPGTASVGRALWAHAERHTPTERVADYTQAIMDLGATLCTRTHPRCADCPIAEDCQAHQAGEAHRYPSPRPARALPTRTILWVVARRPSGDVLLERRPVAGVWGGLWSLPECPVGAEVAGWCQARLGVLPERLETWPETRHTFSHFHLVATPVVATVRDPSPGVLEADAALWYKPGEPPGGGLAAPVARLLDRLAQDPGGAQP
jgi:A/G-specific adenine glycosylase